MKISEYILFLLKKHFDYPPPKWDDLEYYVDLDLGFCYTPQQANWLHSQGYTRFTHWKMYKAPAPTCADKWLKELTDRMRKIFAQP